MVLVAYKFCLTMEIEELYLLRIVEEFNRVGNKIRIRNLGISKDVIVPFHDKLLCLCVLALVGGETAAGSEKEDVASS